MEKFTVDYFIEKFEKIPEKKWTIGSISCAYALCGMYTHPSQGDCKALSDLFEMLPIELPEGYDSFHGCSWKVVFVNDGKGAKEYPQPTPKQRILAALRDIKAMQNKEQEVQESDTTKAKSSEEAKDKKEIIRYVKVEIEEMELVEN